MLIELLCQDSDSARSRDCHNNIDIMNYLLVAGMATLSAFDI